MTMNNLKNKMNSLMDIIEVTPAEILIVDDD